MIERRLSGIHFAAVLAVVALLLLTAGGVGHAHEPYKDSDSNYLKIVDYFAYPVGVLLEWTVARPLHLLETRSVRGHREARTGQVGTLRIRRGCRGLRPPRYCTGKRYAY